MSEINNSAWLMSYHKSFLDHKFKNKEEHFLLFRALFNYEAQNAWGHAKQV